ncbi:extracellular solute-binding protein [Occultella kanbiaonis]|uniref:extracellular solute-binding protein n=1 Tax=Occultella kanbiaonis TaxID=2675754 RepID=UPI0012B82496|nr:substrate-binding domain-containing protein [Occultella kanbiaonis]
MTGSPNLSRRDVLKIGGGLAATVGIGGSLAACSGGNEFEYMFWGSTGEQDAIEAMLAGFQDTQEDLTIKPVYTPADYDTKLNALVASGNVPDLGYVQPAMAYRLAEQGKLLDLAPHFDEYPSLGQRLPGSYFYWEEDKCLGTQGANETVITFYNRAAFAETGAQPPPASAAEAWDWDTYVENAYLLTADQSGRRPDEAGFDPTQVARFGTLASMWSGAWYGLLLSAGVDVVDSSGTRTMLDSPEAIDMFQKLVDLMYEHRVAPSPSQLGNNAPSMAVQLASGRLGMAIDGQWALLDVSQADFDFGVGVLPSLGTPKTTAMGGPTAIFADTEYVEQALELYAFQSDPDQVDLFSSGLWMPLEEKYYTDPEAIASWTDNDAHPPEYKTAVIDYTLENSQTYFTQKLRNVEEIDRLITSTTERIQTGEEDVATVMGELAAQLNDGMLQGVYPSAPQ